MVSQSDEWETKSVRFEQIWHGTCPYVCMCFRKSPSLDGNNKTGESISKDADDKNTSSRTTQLSKSIELTSCIDNNEDTHVNSGVVEKPRSNFNANNEMENNEICICLKLTQLRSENVSTDVHIIMHDFNDATVSFPQETALKTID